MEEKGNKEIQKKKIIPTFLKVILIIIAIILAIVIIYEIAIQYDGNLEKTNYMTRQEVVELLEKGNTYPNYSYEPEQQTLWGNEYNNTTKYYIKDGIVKTLYNGQTLRWDNYNTNEGISLTGENDGKKYAGISETIKYTNSQIGFDYSLIADTQNFNYDYEYMGEIKQDGRTCIYVRVWDKSQNKLLGTKFVIDKQTGLITNRIDYMYLGILLTKVTSNRNVDLDIVTDQDVKRPDLTGYEVINYQQ